MRRLAVCAILVLTSTLPTAAQVQNGNFEGGGESWEVVGNWTFPDDAGLNGAGARFQGPGAGVLSQDFSLPGNSDGLWVMGYWIRWTGTGEETAQSVIDTTRLTVDLQYGQPLLYEYVGPHSGGVGHWTEIVGVISDGPNRISIEVETTAAIRFEIDRIGRWEDVATEVPTWGRIKSLYR